MLLDPDTLFKLIPSVIYQLGMKHAAMNDGIEQIANSVMQKTNSINLIVKMGAEGFIAYGIKEGELINRQHFPALCPNPVDVTGAGDSLFACLAIGLCSGISLMAFQQHPA